MNTKLFGLSMILILITGCAKPGIINQEYKPEQTIHYTQVGTIENISDYIVYMNKGDIIPLRMTLDSHLVELVSEKIDLILKQKIYFRLNKQIDITAKSISSMSMANKEKLAKNIMIYLSPDAKRWVQYTDFKSVEKIIGIKGGAVSFGMGMDKKEGIKIFLNIKTTMI